MLLSIIFPFAFSGFHISKQWGLRAARRGREGAGSSFSANGGSGIVPELRIGAFARGCGRAAEGFGQRREKALLYAFLIPEKSFNVSAACLFALGFIAKVAEGFDFQTFQHCSAVQRETAGGFRSGHCRATAPSPGFARTTPPTENPVAGPVFSIGGVV